MFHVVPPKSSIPDQFGETTDTAPFRRRGSSSLLPDSLKRSSVLFWVAILPQAVLLLLNLRNYQLVAGEMAPWQKSMCANIGAFESLLLLGALALVISLRRRGQTLSWAMCWPLLILPVFYLWLVTFQIGGLLIPQSVSAWILPPERMLYDQFAFMMPLIFYATVRLSCADINVSRLSEFATVLGILIGIPLLFFAVITVPRGWNILALAPVLVCVVIVVISTLMVIAAATRTLVITYVAVRKKGPLALAILAAVIGIIAPISGLLLNRAIPFPADFQTSSVYAMAVVNGLLLLLPNFRNLLVHRVVWLAQCAFFPFTFYFFLVFLPFLPLSIPAMLYVGAGFLVLTPTALFLIHGQRILDGYRNEIRDGGRFLPALLAILALSLIPAFCTVEAIVDRVVLRRAIDYVYSPDYRTDTRFSGYPALVRRSLENLRDFKAGLNLPFLSDFYNWIVFDSLVLPDEKMNRLHRAFFGRDLERPNPAALGLFGTRPGRQQSVRETTVSVPHDVRLVKAEASVKSEGVCDRATISLQMKNDSLSQSEFVAPIQLPEGVLVSGFWLHIGDKRVLGQLFEKKSALWVYQMIRDRSRRDPGLLVYTDPQTLELRVFPFAAQEERKVEIEFLYPAALKPSIRVGSETLHPSGTSEAAQIFVTRTNDDGCAALLSPAALAGLPRTMRTPYLHFIVDRSVSSEITARSVADTIRRVHTQFPNAHECLITAANYESIDLTNDLMAIDSINEPGLDALPRRGGFMAQRAMKRALLRYHDRLRSASTNSAWFGRFPLFIVISDNRTEQLPEMELDAFDKLAPDIAGYYLTVDGNHIEPRRFTGETAANIHAVRPVALLKLGDSIAPCAIENQTPTLISFASQHATGLSAFDAGTHSFVPLTPVQPVPADTHYAGGIAAWQNYLALIYDPSRGSDGLAQIVKRSRESGILVGSTSFIVVENSAQWKVLERMQNKKLRNNAALEIEAVPEPSTWCLIVLGGALLLFCLRRSRISRRLRSG